MPPKKDMKKIGKKNQTGGRLGEEKFEDILSKSGFFDVENANNKNPNNKAYDFIAHRKTESGNVKKYLIQLKTDVNNDGIVTEPTKEQCKELVKIAKEQNAIPVIVHFLKHLKVKAYDAKKYNEKPRKKVFTKIDWKIEK